MIKNIIFNNRNKHRNKNKSTAVTKNELKYFPMSEGNTCIAVSKLEVLPLIWFSKGLVYFLFVISLKTYVWTGDTFLKCSCFTIR